jgi:type II secretory pathway component GspD/PulD (secretin)
VLLRRNFLWLAALLAANQSQILTTIATQPSELLSVEAHPDTKALIAQIHADQSQRDQLQKYKVNRAARLTNNEDGPNASNTANLDDDSDHLNTDILHLAERKLRDIYKDPVLQKGKVTLNSSPADVQTILDSIGKSAGVDFIVDGAKGQVGRLALKNCTPGNALEFVCEHSNPKLAIIKGDDGSFRVMPRVEAEKYLETMAGLDKIAFEPIKVTFADFSQTFMKNCEEAWSKISNQQTHAKGHIYFDADRRKIMVRGSLREVLEFKQFLGGLDKPIQQIRIDAILVFTTKSYNFQWGINWSGVYNRQNSIVAKNKPFGFYGLGASLAETPTPTQGADTTNPALLVNPDNFAINLFNSVFIQQTQGQSGETFFQLPLVFGGPNINQRRLNLVINAAENQNKVKIVSRPSILTNNNQQAVIYIGQQLPMQTTTVDNSGDTPTRTTTIKYQPVGITLKVTPVVGNDRKSIALNIELEQTDVTSGTTEANNQGVMQNPPVVSIISVKNNVSLKNGQTTVIGGLTKNYDNKFNNRIPVLHKIPLIGKLFTAMQEQNTELEQFIFITPTIIENSPI